MLRGLSVFASVIVFALSLAGGCSGDVAPLNPPPPGGDPDVCTDPTKCCQGEYKCEGNPDRGVVCSCKGLWDCDANKSKCSQPLTPPDGSGKFKCDTWNEFNGLRCEREGTPGDVPAGGGQYSCSYNTELKKIVCTENTPTNPSNKPDGAGKWTCEPTMTEGVKKLVCRRKGSKPPIELPPVGGGDWDCNGAKTNCKKKDGDKGLPPGGGHWKCHGETIGGKKYITCTGDSATPPGGGSWTCVKLPNEKSKWLCKRPEGNGDTPPGGGHWACKSGTEFGGRTCTKVKTPPTPPGPYPKPNDVCVPGTKRWCDGLQFCGWGTITCLPNGTWPTTIVDGRKMLDCQERSDGKRPDTACACYHFYYNPKCCERPDCVIPQPKDGQLCKPSQGRLCDYCNPRKPECKTGGICAVSNTMETFCTQRCGAGGSCPKGMLCMSVKSGGRVSKQCIPADMSCYNGL